MSALSSSVTKVPGPGKRVFSFNQPVPIPVYLIALAVGDLACASIGPRSNVWTEPCVLEQVPFLLLLQRVWLFTA